MRLTCSHCKETLESSSFSKKNNTKRGYSYVCKQCHNKYNKDIWYKRNSDIQKAASQQWRERNPLRRIMAEYKITEDEAITILDIHSCQICGKTDQLAIDHDHLTGKVRGRLCVGCNTGLGKLGDSVEGLQKAIDYLNKPH